MLADGRNTALELAVAAVQLFEVFKCLKSRLMVLAASKAKGRFE
jgi:hypothetical protein